MTVRLFLSVFLLNSFYFSSAFSNDPFIHDLQEEKPTQVVPWFTGPLLAPSANTIPAKHVNVEPYIYFIANTGSYNSHWNKVSHPNVYSILFQNFIQVGLTSFMDFQVVPQLAYQFTQGARSTQAGDLPFMVDFQLCKDLAHHFRPSAKLALRASIPFGKYQNLNPNKFGVDGVGTGNWIPAAALIFSKLFYLEKNRFVNARLAFNYTVPNATRVKGLNVYGGDLNTKGTVYPGNVFSCDVAMEYTLTQNWALSADLFYVHANKTKFYGMTLAPVGGPSSEQLSFAPAIEYNWNINIGIITGAWITLTGRNSSCFRGSVTAVNLYF